MYEDDVEVEKLHGRSNDKIVSLEAEYPMKGEDLPVVLKGAHRTHRP